MIVAANKADIPGAERNVEKVVKEFPSTRIVACSAESELALREATKQRLITYLPGDATFGVEAEAQLSDGQRRGLEFISKHVIGKFSSTGVQQALEEMPEGFQRYLRNVEIAVRDLPPENLARELLALQKQGIEPDDAFFEHHDVFDV